MIYIVFTIATVINIFNIALIAKNTVAQNVKEKVLLVTYSLAEFIYIFYILTLIEYTAANMVFALSFIIIWLLSKAYICTLNINFEDIEEEGTNDMEENNNLEQNTNQIEECQNEEIIDNTEQVVETTNNELEENESISDLDSEKLELSDLVENSLNNTQKTILTRNSLYTLSDIVETAEINEAEERRARRRSLALRVSKINNVEQK